MKRNMIMLVLLGSICCSSLLTYGQTPTVLWSENWENGTGSWFADNGVWESGIPSTNPPLIAYEGQECAGTDLDAAYPANADTRWIGPPIDLNVSLQANESLELRFWHWFNNYPEDPCVVQLSTDNGNSWTTISSAFTWNSNGWTRYNVDISQYAGSVVRLGFYFTSNNGNQANGWYIDDISIVQGVFALPLTEDFEGGIGDWYADKGVWQIGPPTTNPPLSPHSGLNCAGTVLEAAYPAYSDSRLVSPRITLPSIGYGEELQFRFWHWFNNYPEDPCVVQLSTDDGDTWTQISNPFTWNSNAWTQYIADISAYAGMEVRFAFYFSSNNGNQANGWYIDDLSIVKGMFYLGQTEDFELGIKNWYADKGVWEVGTPTTGPGAAHTGLQCAATVLGGAYPAYADSRLISPKFVLIPKAGEIPGMFFWHWFNIYAEDPAVVQISANGGEWETKTNAFSSNSGWSQYYLDLSEYSSDTIQVAFYFSSNNGNQANGWFIDDIRFEGVDTIFTGLWPGPEREIQTKVFPNPFSSSVSLEFQIEEPEEMSIEVYNVEGRMVHTFGKQLYPPGTHQLVWAGNNRGGQTVPSGMYLYRIAGERSWKTGKIIRQ